MSDERAFQQVHRDLEATIPVLSEMRLSAFPRPPESPIERMMVIGLVGFAMVVPRYTFAGSKSECGDSDSWPTMHVDTQVPLGRFRVDILVRVTLAGKELGTVVVECDGHDFHERTKAQAERDRSRDREMTLAGHTVLRFTGSEIHRDLPRCAADVHEACWKIFLKASAE
jgi:very-short-patch-repair endonuclease